MRKRYEEWEEMQQRCENWEINYHATHRKTIAQLFGVLISAIVSIIYISNLLSVGF